MCSWNKYFRFCECFFFWYVYRLQDKGMLYRVGEIEHGLRMRRGHVNCNVFGLHRTLCDYHYVI